MISHLKGTVIFSGDKFVILDVAGVGYKVAVTPDTLRRSISEKEVALWIHLAVREDSMSMYGFLEREELELFEMLIGISGVGPKSAIGVLSVASVDALKSAIASGDTSYLTKVSGIGKKNAEKIVLELRDKLGGSDTHVASHAGFKEELDVVEALKSLGYSQREAREALKDIPDTVKGTSPRVKAALKNLGKQPE
ncbi:MAG: Holliday junction branch migration protein RuvA [Candidatus Yonathbacteria bacterium]|nr:Holliday junction branch migration protein RuvA [Candidatus Yonathbacteria bacterium]